MTLPRRTQYNAPPMKDKQLPLTINPTKFAEQGVIFEGSVEPDLFERFVEQDIGRLTDVKVKLHFGRNDQGIANAVGDIEASVNWICQRCLEYYDQPLKASVKLAIIKSEQEAEDLPEEFEPFVQTDSKVPVVDMIEDELLLVLPVVPLHEQCQNKHYTPDPEIEVEKPNPFEVLKALKQK